MGSEQALRLSSLLFSSGFPHLPRYERTNVHALSPTSGARADGDEPWEEKRASPGHPDGEQGGLGEMQAGQDRVSVRRRPGLPPLLDSFGILYVRVFLFLLIDNASCCAEKSCRAIEGKAALRGRRK